MEVGKQYILSYCSVSSSSLSGEIWDLAALAYVVPGVNPSTVVRREGEGQRTAAARIYILIVTGMHPWTSYPTSICKMELIVISTS